MKILYLIDKMPRAGTQQHIVQVVLGLDRQRYRPVVCTLLEEGVLAATLRKAGVPVYSLGMPRVSGWRFPVAVWRLMRLIRREHPGVVHAYLAAANIIGSVAARLAGVPAVITSRRDLGNELTPVQRLLQRWSVRWTDRVMVNSMAVWQVAMTTEQVPRSKLHLIPNGVAIPSETIAPAADIRQMLPDGALVIGMVGNVRPLKGQDLLIEVLPEILQSYPNSHVLIAGSIKDPAYRQRLQELADRLAVTSRIHFLGERSDVPQVLAACDLFVHPSYREGNSNAILEAMATGRPVISTDIGAAPEIIQDGVNGILIPCGDPVALAKAVKSLLDYPQERQAMGQAARASVEQQFSVEAMLERIDRLYQSLQPKLAYITSQFPCYDETFIVREMAELKRQGLPFLILPLKISRDPIVHGQATGLMDSVISLPFFSLSVLWAQAQMFLRHPIRYVSALGWILGKTIRRPAVFLKSLLLFPKAVALARLAERRGLRHLHAHWASHPTTAAIVIHRLTGLPFIFTGHAHDIYLDTTLLPEKLAQARFVATCTSANRDYLLGLTPSVDRNKVVVIYHGLDLERFHPPQRHALNGSGPLRILSVGSLYECKGFDILLKACARLKGMGIGFHCTIAGGGRLESALRALIQELGLAGQVTLTGYVTQDQLIPLYQAADLFVLAARPEQHWGIPNVVVEAMAAGLPAICTALPSMPEIIDHQSNGWLLAAPEPEVLADAIAMLARQPAKRRLWAERALTRVTSGWDVIQNTKYLKSLFESSASQALEAQVGT